MARAAHTLCVVSAILLVACSAIPMDQAKSEIAQRPACCKTLTDLPYKTLSPGAREAADLGASSLVFVFPEGPAPFQAFALPQTDSPRSLIIQSMTTTGYLPAAQYVDPIIEVLNSEKKVIATFSSLNLRYGRHKPLPGFYSYYHGATVELPAAARFVVVRPDMSSTRSQTAYAENGNPHSVRPGAYGTVILILS